MLKFYNRQLQISDIKLVLKSIKDFQFEFS